MSDFPVHEFEQVLGVDDGQGKSDMGSQRRVRNRQITL